MPNAKPNQQQSTSHITRRGRILAEHRTAGGRAQAPAPFMHRDPANIGARENQAPRPPPLGP